MLNNQVSIAGQSTRVAKTQTAGELLSCADHFMPDTKKSSVGAAHFDQQATEILFTRVGVPADHLSTVGGQALGDYQNRSAADHPSTSKGQISCETHKPGADAHLQEPDGQISHDNQSQSAIGFDISGEVGHVQCDSHLFHADHPTLSEASQVSGETHSGGACFTPLDDDGQDLHDNQRPFAEVVTPKRRDQATIARIKTLYKQRNDIIRAHGNLTRQVTSICYHAVGFNTFLPEKQRAAAMKAGNRLLADLKAGNLEAAIVFDSAGYLLHVIDQSGFDKQKRIIEKKMEKAVASLGMEDFIASVSGFSSVQLANIIGEAGDIANYGTVSRLWKRMGMAVIDGVRQSKQSDKGKALDHGYNPSRRSAMWNIGETLIKAQIRSAKDDAGEKTGESIAIGPLGQVYLDRKKYYAALHLEKTKAHIHNDAKRYMEKRLLKMLWRAWNQ